MRGKFGNVFSDMATSASEKATIDEFGHEQAHGEPGRVAPPGARYNC